MLLRFSFICLLFTLGQTASAQPEMKWDTTFIDYGVVLHDSDPFREFTYTNAGDAPLIITRAIGSCGCLVPTYPRDPLAPGDTAVVEMRYDTRRLGVFNKRLTITTNEPDSNQHILTVIGEVVTDTTTTSTDVSNIQLGIKFWPNPVMDMITLEIPRLNAPFSVTIFDLNGRESFDNNFPSTTGGSVFPQIDVSFLAPGAYLLFLTKANGERLVEKFIKS